MSRPIRADRADDIVAGFASCRAFSRAWHSPGSAQPPVATRPRPRRAATTRCWATATRDCGDVCCAPDEVCEVASQTCVPTSCDDGRAVCGAGAEATCCAASDECVLGSCEPMCASERCGDQQVCCPMGEVCDVQAGACVPECPADRVCGPQEDCCAMGDVCFLDSCVTPGDACQENFQCQSGQYCEPTLEACLPVDLLPGCTYIPTENFDPTVEWEWNGSSTLPDYMQVMMAPVVANMTDDNGDGVIDTGDVPDVVFSTFGPGGYGLGYIRVISGDDGSEHYTYDAQQVAGASSIAVGDIDGDDRPEVIGVGANYGGLVAFEDTGEVKWTTSVPSLFWGGATLVDLDQDGDVEILAGSHVFDHEGNELWNTSSTGCGNGRHLVAAADIDRDIQKSLEVFTGRCVLDSTGGVITTMKDASGNTGPNGFPAIGNFDADPFPELIAVDNSVHMYEHDGTHRWSVPTPGSNLGPPTVGNFIDDDLAPEIAVASSTNYLVIDEVDDGNGNLVGQIVFQKPTTDASSSVTGSSIFDFEGDGVAEAVYNDECFIHVYDTRFDPSDPASDKFKLPNSSGTTHEYPIIADVDNDGNAELIAIRNDYAGSIYTRCNSTWPDWDPSGFGHGIRVFGDANDNWVASRRIWNQHAYWVTHVTEDAKVVQFEERNYDSLNNFRQNTQNNAFFAPDLTATNLMADTSSCPGTLTFTVELCNEGAQGVGKGTPVAFYQVAADGTRTLVATGETSKVLLPGNCETITGAWTMPPVGEQVEVIAVADDPGDGTSVNNECDESDNESTAITSQCNIN